MAEVLSRYYGEDTPGLAAIHALLERQEQLVRQVAADLEQAGPANGPEPGRDSILESFIHMMLNRLLPASHRLHEMVIYEFLYRQYR